MELEALYEGLCRREPDLFEPESLHKQIDAIAPAVSLETLEALLQLCEDWQKHAFAVGFYDCRPAAHLINHRLSPCGAWIELTAVWRCHWRCL